MKNVLMIAHIMFVIAVFSRQCPPAFLDAMRSGAAANIHLHVVDDERKPVPSVEVRIFMGMNFREKGYWIEGTTDTNGVYIIEGKTTGNEIEIYLAKNGYYESYRKLCFIDIGAEREVQGGKWQPWGADDVVELRKIRRQTQMSVACMRDFHDTNVTNSWLGFDLDKFDLVRPYGKGMVADFEVLFDWDGRCFAEYNGMTLRIRFVEKYSGYYPTIVSKESIFSWPYVALSEVSYHQSAEFFERVKLDGSNRRQGYDRQSFDKGRCWIIRSRCKIDDEGNLLSAHYSVVNNIEFGYDRGGMVGICVTGAFNPVPNDRNLEPVRK